MVRKLAFAALVALVAVLAAGWLSARAGDPDGGEDPVPLALHLEADSQVCTAGSFTEVRWEISGGVEPYEATLNGQPVDASSGAATIACGAALAVPDWLRGIIPPAPVDVELAVADVSEAEARESLRLNRAPPLPAPVVSARPQTASTSVHASALGVGHGTTQVRRYLVRWRPVGGAEWAYERSTASSTSRWSDSVFSADTGGTGVRLEIEVAQVRSFAEQEEIDLLNWSDTTYATTGSPPTDLTARATHDTITISWGPAVEGLAWTTTIGPMGDRDRDRDRRWGGNNRSAWIQKAAGPGLPYEVSYGELLPDTLYGVRVRLDDNCFDYGYGDDLCAPSQGLLVRTAPAPPGWSREPRQPQNVQATAHAGGGGIRVAWDPPLEGEERVYAVIAYEYGTPRANPITPVGGVGGRSYVLRLPLDTTYQVIVQHLGIEDEEARVVWEPRPAQERTDTIMPPAWHVDYQEPTHSGREPGYEFTVLWDTQDDDALVQVRWLKDGYAMTQSAENPPIIIRTTKPGPHPFQLRIRRHGYWSQWSSIQRASAKPPTPQSVEVRERNGMLEARWTPPETWRFFRSWWDPTHDPADQIDGFRVYLYRAGESERVLDVGLSTSAEFPIPADGGEYEVHVATYSKALGESRAAVRTFSQAAGPTLHVVAPTASGWLSDRCVPYQGRPAIVWWQLRGGAAPYTIKVGNAEAFETTDHTGYVKVRCDSADTRGEATVEATVTDARGRVGKTTIRLQIGHPPGDTAASGSAAAYWRERVAGLALGRIYVRPDSFILRWNRYLGRPHDVPEELVRTFPLFVVRWRDVGAEHWLYRVTDDPDQNSCRVDSSRWTLEGLTPGTEYEVQIALDLSTIDIVDDRPLDWSESRFARTLPATIDANARREGPDIIVSWLSIAEARNYVVTLHGEDVNWAKAYQPQGNTVEEAVFVDVPVELTSRLRVEVTTGQGISADPGGAEIEDFAYCD